MQLGLQSYGIADERVSQIVYVPIVAEDIRDTSVADSDDCVRRGTVSKLAGGFFIDSLAQ